ncbi:MAG: hypothetical protein K2P33_00905, partial [Acutalibacter sp.]|nr:hypothetical protein [Acutalibacter sp.]
MRARKPGLEQKRRPASWAGFLFFFLFRACLKIEEMTNFYPEEVHFKEKTARQSSDWRGFL